MEIVVKNHDNKDAPDCLVRLRVTDGAGVVGLSIKEVHLRSDDLENPYALYNMLFSSIKPRMVENPERLVTQPVPVDVALLSEFKKLAIIGHTQHSGQSTQWDKIDFEQLRDCEYSFCRVRYHLALAEDVVIPDAAPVVEPEWAILAELKTTNDLLSVLVDRSKQ